MLVRAFAGLFVLGFTNACQIQKDVVLGFMQDLKEVDGIKTVEDCCAECNKTGGCVAFTYHQSGEKCYLKNGVSQTKQETGAISGTRDGPMPPSPPPTPKPGWDACTGPNSSYFKFCDVSMSIADRVADLAARIDINSAGAQLTARQSPAYPAAELPAYYWGTNAIHGLQNVGCLSNGQCPTSFPAPCALSAAFNSSLVKDMGKVIGTELRAYYNAEVHDSLDTWSPTINLNRDPRWGRNVESPGEDPYVCGQYGTAYTQGLQQGPDPQWRMATVTLKHWVAYSVESYNGVTRHNFNANVSAYDLATSYLPAWEETIKVGGAKGVMCSYNMVNGKPTCGNKNLTDVLREDWGFTGYITSDSDSCADIWKSHHYETSGEAATRDCLVSGTDIDSGGTYKSYLASGVTKKIVDEETVLEALRNSYRMRFEMGLFEGQNKSFMDSPLRQIKTDVVGSAAHQEMSLLSARQGMVLLKNSGSALPFAKGKHVAVIGQNVNSTQALTGNYDGPLCPKGGAACFPSIAQAVESLNGAGSVTVVTSITNTADAVAAAKAADQVVLVVDNAKDGGGEGHDRQTISLSSAQVSLCDAVLDAALGKPIVLVMVNGGAISIDGLKERAPSILEAFMPGVHGGTAVAETIFGDNNPGGKLPITIYHSNYTSEVDFLDMSMTAGPGRSYKYYTGTPLFPCFFGLSFTTFTLEWTPQPSRPTQQQQQQSTTVVVVRGGTAITATKYTVKVTNTGTIAGDEVVFAFVKPQQASSLSSSAGMLTPVEAKRLFAFERVHLDAGASTTLTFEVNVQKHLAMVDSDGHSVLQSGSFDVMLSRGHGKELTSTLQLEAQEPVRTKTFRKWW
jgi:beta-glucosidase-like glycosyl hydrolase